jgi:hypothetical protein
MIAKKCQIGSSFRSASEYLMHGTNAREPNRGIVIDSNIPGVTPREWSRNVAAFRQLRPSLGKAVYHGSLNPAPGDRLLTDAELGEMARIFLDEMGFATCPYLIVRHPSESDGDGHRPDHIHILALRINAKGETVSDRNDYRRAETIVRRLETRFGLTPVPPSDNHNNKEMLMTPEKQKAIEARLDENHDQASMALNLGMIVECGDANLSERRKREFKRELLSATYQQAIRDTFLDSIRFIHPSARGGLTIHTRDGGRLVDSGDKVAAFAMGSQVAAEQLIELAILKGWESVVLRGDEAFIRHAMTVALQKGLAVKPTDARQLTIWLDVKRKHGDSGDGAPPGAPAAIVAPVADPAPTVADLVAVPIVPATPATPVKPSLVSGLSGLGGLAKRRQEQQQPQGTDSAGVPVNPLRPFPFKR